MARHISILLCNLRPTLLSGRSVHGARHFKPQCSSATTYPLEPVLSNSLTAHELPSDRP
jgi:hypothetical protein